MDEHNGIPIIAVDQLPSTSRWDVTYGDRSHYPNPTWQQRIRIRYWRWKDRIRDAWLVLQGKAEIDEY